MKTTFEICLILAAVALPLQLLYWYAFRPVLLLRLRYKLFQSRDSLRLMVLEGKVGEKDKAFPLLDRFVNRCIANFDRLDMAEVISTRLKQAEQLEVKRDIAIITESGLEYRKVFNRTMIAVVGMIMANSPGFILISGVLAIPVVFFAILAFWFNRFRRVVDAMFAKFWGFLNHQPATAACA